MKSAPVLSNVPIRYGRYTQGISSEVVRIPPMLMLFGVCL